MPLRCAWLSGSHALPVAWKARVADAACAPAAPKPPSEQRASAPAAARTRRCMLPPYVARTRSVTRLRVFAGTRVPAGGSVHTLCAPPPPVRALRLAAHRCTSAAPPRGVSSPPSRRPERATARAPPRARCAAARAPVSPALSRLAPLARRLRRELSASRLLAATSVSRRTMPPAAAPAFDAAARGAAPAATSAAAPAPPAGAAPAGGDASVAPPRRRRRVAVQKEADTVTTVTTVLLGAVTLAVGASLVEAGLRAWRAAARRRRREKERKARGSQDTTPPNTPPPLRVDTRMHQARALTQSRSDLLCRTRNRRACAAAAPNCAPNPPCRMHYRC